jgi:hypothetical protein
MFAVASVEIVTAAVAGVTQSAAIIPAIKASELDCAIIVRWSYCGGLAMR